MGMLDMATYTQLQAADAMRDAANNQGGGAGLTAGIGAGMGIGNLMGQALQGGMQSGQQQKAPSGGAPVTNGMSDVMTPSEAAAALKVIRRGCNGRYQGWQPKSQEARQCLSHQPRCP